MSAIKELEIDGAVKSELDNVKQIISGTALYRAVVEKLSNHTRNTAAQIKYLDAYEQAIAVFRTAALELRKEMDVLTLEQRLGAQEVAIQDARQLRAANTVNDEETEGLKRKISDAIFFSNRYALFFAGHVGLALLDAQQADIKNQFSFGTKYDNSKNRDELTERLAKTAALDLSRIVDEKEKQSQQVGDEDLKYTLEAIFTSWIKQFNWLTFKDVAEAYGAERVKLKFANYSLQAGEFKKKHSQVIVDEKFMAVTKSEVIGSQEFGRIIWQNLLKLSAFDCERKRNPYDPASVIFTYGEPGGGKTFTSHAYVQSFADLCSEKGVTLWAFTHSTTDYASHYQNLTANQLSELAGKINAFPGIVIMYVADADNIFQSRKNPQLSAEQQQTLGVYFKMFDGTFIPKNGKFIAIMDANYIEGIDDATKSRLFDEVVELKRFDKAEDFAELARRSLTKGTNGLVLTKEDWLSVGGYLLDSQLSNREIGHVIKQLRRGFSVQEDMIGLPFEAHENYRNEQMAGITKDKVLSQFDTYIKTRMEIERASYEAKRKDDAARFLTFLEMKAQPIVAAK